MKQDLRNPILQLREEEFVDFFCREDFGLCRARLYQGPFQAVILLFECSYFAQLYGALSNHFVIALVLLAPNSLRTFNAASF